MCIVFLFVLFILTQVASATEKAGLEITGLNTPPPTIMIRPFTILEGPCQECKWFMQARYFYTRLQRVEVWHGRFVDEEESGLYVVSYLRNENGVIQRRQRRVSTVGHVGAQMNVDVQSNSERILVSIRVIDAGFFAITHNIVLPIHEATHFTGRLVQQGFSTDVEFFPRGRFKIESHHGIERFFGDPSHIVNEPGNSFRIQ